MRPVRIVGTYLLYISLALNLVVLLYPALNKVYHTELYREHSGFLASCNCTWYSNMDENGSNTISVLKDIWIHWLYIGAIAVINICLFSWFVLSVFDEKVHYAAMIIIGVFMLAAAGLIAAAIVLFGQKMNKELDVHLTGDNSFGWAMWLGVGGFAIVTITGLVFVIQGPSLYRSYKHRRS
ncbi:hypothetical protein LSH36_40g04011 [Paralvinella palmiformis]|uniref:Uncharacterized protein n=1 Tax=Paralvinella palmiformis TaxID=53620 RepID=A0AAD9K907_9ANNE|nr:hypothetical protein LSH36_40g04011 [Paralvinella palmiformis]